MAEMNIVPEGIRKGYLKVIDFDILSRRINNFRPDLLNIIQKLLKSIIFIFLPNIKLSRRGKLSSLLLF